MSSEILSFTNYGWRSGVTQPSSPAHSCGNPSPGMDHPYEVLGAVRNYFFRKDHDSRSRQELQRTNSLASAVTLIQNNCEHMLVMFFMNSSSFLVLTKIGLWFGSLSCMRCGTLRVYIYIYIYIYYACDVRRVTCGTCDVWTRAGFRLRDLRHGTRGMWHACD